MITLLYHISELQAFLVACYYYRYLRGSFMKWLAPFLGFIFFADVSIYIQSILLDLEYPVVTFYLLQVIQTVFYGYFFSKLADSKIVRRLVILMWFICIPSYVLNFFFSGNSTSKNLQIIMVLSNIFIAVLSIIYVYLIIIRNDGIKLTDEPGWWIAIGVSLFSSCVCIGQILYKVIRQNNLRLFGMYLYNLIPQLMSLILYSFISISIILYARRAKQKPAFE
jgi:hypothetical protein